MAAEAENGRPQPAVTLELSLPEAQALRNWLLKPAADGTTTLDDATVKAAQVKLTAALDHIEGVAAIRQELEQAGFPSTQLSDEQVVALGKRISETSRRLTHA